MEITDQIQQLNFLEIAQRIAPVETGSVRFYSLINTDIHVRKKCTADFEAWIITYNHFDNTTVIITGAAPVENAEDYTLLIHIEDFVKLPLEQPVLLVPVPEDAQPE
jgi:hypothetical protein